MEQPGKFTKQVALVTGAGEGIGFEIASQLAAEGASVALNDVRVDRAADAARTITNQGGRCMALPGDAGNLEVVKELVNMTVDSFGTIDIAVANAGVTVWNDFLSFEPADFQRVMSVNLGGSFFLAQAAARHMIARKEGGRILFMSSVTGSQSLPYLSAYSMTKAGIEGLARTLVSELSPHGITVNVIAPGATMTPRNLADDPNYESVWSRLSPTQRVSFPRDIAQAALFLLSPEAAQITGQTLTVDGGWSITSPIPPLNFVKTSEKPESPNESEDNDGLKDKEK